MKFKELLKQVDLSASQVARRIGVTRESVCSWVKGKTSPTAVNIAKIAKALNVTSAIVLDCFLDNEPTNKTAPEEGA